MTRDTLARIKLNNKHFEISVDLDLAIKLRKGENVNLQSILLVNTIFTNVKDGSRANSADLTAAFGTTDVFAIADRIIKRGEIQLPQEYRDEQQDNKKKQIIDFFVRNAVDARNGRPFTPQTIENSLSQAGVNIANAPIETQVPAITEKLQKILPLKIELKRLAITIQAAQTGKAYGLLNQYKEKEEWLPNGDLKVIVKIPVGLQSEFYDKLNAITHGSALTEEIKSL